ncbi:MAG: lipoate--protein ligase [Bacteroidales bacterium]|nr:lipoate--protein ligase [Bacteroidales bacterium]
MLCIVSENTDPYFNLASEEYLLKNFTEDLFLLYRNEPAIVVGKHQNTFSEINYRYVLENNIKVARRISGGGTVFHDLGNLNFSFITTGEPGFQVNYIKYLEPIVAALDTLGVKAVISERHDLFIKGKKITGTASHVHKNRVMHHGTLLFSSEIASLRKALKTDPGIYQDRAVKSIRSGITNIKAHLNRELDVLQFRDIILNHILCHFEGSRIYQYTEQDLKEIARLRLSRFITWEWNFGYSPKYQFRKEIATSGGILEINLNVEKGIIQEVRIMGEFIDLGDVKMIEERIAGTIHDPPAIRMKLSGINVPEIILGVDVEDLVAGMF